MHSGVPGRCDRYVLSVGPTYDPLRPINRFVQIHRAAARPAYLMDFVFDDRTVGAMENDIAAEIRADQRRQLGPKGLKPVTQAGASRAVATVHAFGDLVTG